MSFKLFGRGKSDNVYKQMFMDIMRGKVGGFDRAGIQGAVTFDSLYKISIVYTVISTNSKVIANIGNVFYNGAGDVVEREKLTGNLRTFMFFPNPDQVLEDFIEVCAIHYDFYGEVVVEISKENYSAHVLVPRSLRTPGDFDRNGYYTYMDKGGSRRIHKDDIVRITNPSPSTSKVGFSPLESVKEALTIIRYFNKNMSDKHRENLFVDGVIELSQYRDINVLRDMTVLFSEVLKESRVPAISGKFKAIDLSKTIEANIKLQEVIEQNVFRAFNVQPIIMGKSDIQKATAFVQASLYKSLCLVPRVKKLTRLMNEIIFKIFAPRQFIKFTFDMDNFSILNDAQEEAVIRKLDFETGMYTSNELRALRGAAPHPEGNYLKPFWTPQIEAPVIPPKALSITINQNEKAGLVSEKQKNESLDVRFASRNSQRIKMFSDFNKAFSDIKEPLFEHFERNYMPKGASIEDIKKNVSRKVNEIDAEIMILMAARLTEAYFDGLAYLPKAMGRLYRYFKLSDGAIKRITDLSQTMFVDPAHFVDMPGEIIDYMRSIVKHGVEQNLGAQEIARQLKQKIDTNFGARAERISRTEAGKMSSYTAYHATKEAGYKFIMWITSSAEPREWHLAMNGVVTGIDEGFNMPPDSPDAFMQHPHDPMASAGNVVNCLCDFVEVPDPNGGDDLEDEFTEYIAVNE